MLQSLHPPGAATNPFVVELVDSLREIADVHYFSWRRALTGRYDVFHVHWPERLLRARTGPRSAVRQAQFVALLLRLRVRGIPIVRTVHNLRPHEPGSWLEAALLRWLDARTSAFVLLSPEPDGAAIAPVPEAAGTAIGPARVLIRHGHYRHAYAGLPVPEIVPGRLLYFGLIRPYKGVLDLIEVFAATAEPALSLRIVGRPEDPELGAAVRRAIAADPRVEAVLDYVDEATLAAEIGAAELVVLPYEEMHNSGAALLALSLDRPILVPDSPANAALAAEVGREWVYRYTGRLTPDALVEAWTASRLDRLDGRPDLSAREWDRLAAEHLALYDTLTGRPG